MGNYNILELSSYQLFLSLERMSLTFQVITQIQRHKSKNQKHVVLDNDLLYLTVSHIQMLETSPIRKVVSNEKRMTQI